jgi:hypothetical protein
VPLSFPDDAATGPLSIHILLETADLLPLGTIIELMNDPRGIAQERPHDPRRDNDVHDPALH